jgi:MazG family protein
MESRMPGDPCNQLDSLRAIVARLRAPGGCPWDRAQTHGTLRAGLLEEAYEVVAAIDAGDDANLREELGDVLLQVVFHAQIAAEEGRFDFDDVARGIADKLVRRHPHVFGDDHCADSAAVLVRWDELKRAEKGESRGSLLDGVSRGLSGLMRAEQMQTKAARAGFDWENITPILAKLREEIAEVEDEMREQEAAGSPSPARLEEEVGDVFFAAVNLARKLQIDAELALQRASDKFNARFRKIEQLAHERGRILDTMTLAEMDALWEEVKSGNAA